jgi:TonB family protein
MPGVQQQANRRARGKSFGIHAFPKEFERNIWEELDRRFYIILIASLAVVYGFIIYLSNVHFSQEQVEQAIKKTYLKKIYEAEIVEETPVVKKAATNEGPGIAEEAVPETPKPAEPDVRAKKDKGKRVEGRGASASQRALRRRRAEQVRRSQRSALNAKVAGGGVLGVLTAAEGQGVGVAEAGALTDVGGGGVNDLDKVLNGVGSLQNASSEQKHSRLGARTIGSGTGNQKGVGIDDIVTGGVGETGNYSIARQGDFSLKMGKGRVTGHAAKATARSADAIEALINKHQDAIIDCYKRVARLNPNLKGSITVQFTIEPNGRVSAVRVIQSTLNNTKVESCITRRIRSWRFQPIDPKEGRAIFRQKFVFTT